MNEEKQLLIDIVKFSPNKSIWAISQDSLDNLPEEFKNLIIDKRVMIFVLR